MNNLKKTIQHNNPSDQLIAYTQFTKFEGEVNNNGIRQWRILQLFQHYFNRYTILIMFPLLHYKVHNIPSNLLLAAVSTSCSIQLLVSFWCLIFQGCVHILPTFNEQWLTKIYYLVLYKLGSHKPSLSHQYLWINLMVHCTVQSQLTKFWLAMC